MSHKQGKASRAKNKVRRQGLKISRNQERKRKYEALAAAGHNSKKDKRDLLRNKKQRKLRIHREPDRNRGGRGGVLSLKQFLKLARA